MFFAVSIAYFRFQIVQVSRFMAGSCYPSWFATESALYCVLDKCLVRRNGTSSFQNTVEWKQVSSFFFVLNVGPAKNSTLTNVVFMYAKSNTLTLKLRSGNKSERIVNLTPIQSIWFHETTINNVFRWLSIAIGQIRESSHLICDAAKLSKQCFSSFLLL